MKSLRTNEMNNNGCLILHLICEGSKILNEMIGKHQSAHNYRMLPKMWRQKQNMMALAKQAEKQGFLMTALEHYEHAIEA